MSSSWGKKVTVTVFGESHGQAIGVTVDGIEAGLELDFEYIDSYIKRRAPGKNRFSTQRKESDFPEIISGVLNGVTTGFPITAIIKNTNQHSGDYSRLLVPRPGHADYTAYIKYNGFADMRGGGHFSGRLTAPLVFAGALCSLALKKKNIEIGAHALSIAGIYDDSYDYTSLSSDTLLKTKESEYPVLNNEALLKMQEQIDSAFSNSDSVGGIIECGAINVPAGLGSPMFESVESVLSSILFSVPAVKGVEFGAGFEVSKMRGSLCNDEFFFEDNKVKTKTNNNGGINGGITNGMPLVFKVALKPTPSIAQPQNSINLEKGCNEILEIKGRHDPCIVFRAVPVIEAVTAIALINLFGDA
ncbi:MAG: chorismate synthase [Ruminococcaceae bacterium]|nr:chorismate synthase [Oscillospiraceae bacterium]